MRGGNRKWDALLERGIEVLVASAVLMATVLFGGVRATELAIVTALLGMAALLWMARIWVDGAHRFLLHPVLVPVLGFVAYAAWRAGSADVPYLAWQEAWLLGVYALGLVLALQNLHGQDVLLRTTWAASIAGAVLATYAVGQFLGESDAVLWASRPAAYARRAGATFVNPNHFGTLMVMFIPMAMAQAFLGRAKAVVRVVHGYAALVMLAGLAVTMSRGGWLAGAVALVGLLGWLAGRRRQLRVPALVVMGLFLCAGGAFVALSPKARLRVEGLQRADTADSGDRRPMWRPALAMWRDHPWMGVGPAQYDVWYPHYREAAMQARPEYAHSEYLNTLADYGVVGSALAAAALAALVASAILCRKYVERGSGDLGDKGSNRFAFFAGATLGLVGLAIHSIGEFPMHIPALGLLAMVLAGHVASLARFASDRWWFTPRFPSKLVASAMILAGLAALSPAAWRGFREARALARARGETLLNADFLRALESAAAIAPGNPHTALMLGEGLRQASFFGGSEWTARRPEAFAWLEKAAALNPHDPKPRMALAEAWAWEPDLDRAVAQSAKACALAPRFVAAANLHGWILFQRGQFREAREQFQQSLEWEPWSNHFARAYLGACDTALGTPPSTPKP